MGNVIKSKRKPSQFEASHNLIKVRDEITKLVMEDFGFSVEKANARRDKFLERFKGNSNIDNLIARYDMRTESFDKWFIQYESETIIKLLQEITNEFVVGNSIYPSETPIRLFEFAERRNHLTKAIALCYVLKSEVEYVIRVLPVDVNKFEHYAEIIDKQILLFKGVKKSDNKLLKSSDAPLKSLLSNLEHIVRNLLTDNR